MNPSPATVERCRCRAYVLRGDCELGIESHVDVMALSAVGLAVGLLTHRRIFDLVRERGRWTIRGRPESASVARLSGGWAFNLILAEHLCHAPLPDDGRNAADLINPPPDPLAALGIVIDLPPPF